MQSCDQNNIAMSFQSYFFAFMFCPVTVNKEFDLDSCRKILGETFVYSLVLFRTKIGPCKLDEPLHGKTLGNTLAPS